MSPAPLHTFTFKQYASSGQLPLPCFHTLSGKSVSRIFQRFLPDVLRIVRPHGFIQFALGLLELPGIRPVTLQTLPVIQNKSNSQGLHGCMGLFYPYQQSGK